MAIGMSFSETLIVLLDSHACCPNSVPSDHGPILILHFSSMHTRIYFEILRERGHGFPLWDAVQEIRLAYAHLLDRLGSTEEEPRLFRVLGPSECVTGFFPLGVGGFRRSVQLADGLVSIDDDPWHATATAHFLAWLSKRFPETVVVLYSPGGVLRPGRITFREGYWEWTRVTAWDRFVLALMTWRLRLGRTIARAAFDASTIFDSVSVAMIEHRPEVAALAIDPCVAKGVAIEAILPLLQMPWDDPKRL